MPADSYVKRTVARVLMQYISLERDDRQVRNIWPRICCFSVPMHTRAQSLAAASSSTGGLAILRLSRPLSLLAKSVPTTVKICWASLILYWLRNCASALQRSKASWAQLAEGPN